MIRTDMSSTANPTWGDIFECCFKARSSTLELLFSLKRGKRDVRALSFELSKMTPQVGLAVIYSIAWYPPRSLIFEPTIRTFRSSCVVSLTKIQFLWNVQVRVVNYKRIE
jgi:hypothetical protein